jgi:hypothetical protein
LKKEISSRKPNYISHACHLRFPDGLHEKVQPGISYDDFWKKCRVQWCVWQDGYFAKNKMAG